MKLIQTNLGATGFLKATVVRSSYCRGQQSRRMYLSEHEAEIILSIAAAFLNFLEG